MDNKRRDFVKMFGVAPVLFLPGIASATKRHTNNAAVTDAGPHIEKSVRANFGGGFSVRTYTQSGGLTYADIEHRGNRYVVASADMQDWKIMSSDGTL